MSLSPSEERAFRAIVAAHEPARAFPWRSVGWAFTIVACLCAVGVAGPLDAPWLAAAGWLGLIAAGLAAVARPDPEEPARGAR